MRAGKGIEMNKSGWELFEGLVKRERANFVRGCFRDVRAFGCMPEPEEVESFYAQVDRILGRYFLPDGF